MFVHSTATVKGGQATNAGAPAFSAFSRKTPVRLSPLVVVGGYREREDSNTVYLMPSNTIVTNKSTPTALAALVRRFALWPGKGVIFIYIPYLPI